MTVKTSSLSLLSKTAYRMQGLTNFLLTAGLWLVVNVALSQKAVITEISDINPISKEKYVFPVVTIIGNETATNNINKVLREELLELDSTGYKKSIFENIWKRENLTGGFDGWVYTDFAYTILNNNDRNVCLSVTFVGGKHLQSQVAYFLFDNFAGKPIQLHQLLTVAGQKWLVNTMISAEKKRVRQYISSLADSLKLPPRPNAPKNGPTRDEFRESYQFYKECLAQTIPGYTQAGISNLLFYIRKDTLFAEGFGCAYNWNGTRLDDLGDYRFSRTLKHLLPYLTPYGKKICL